MSNADTSYGQVLVAATIGKADADADADANVRGFDPPDQILIRLIAPCRAGGL